MRETAKPLAMKPYLDAIEHLCDSLSRKELTQLVLHLAGDIPARERASYLDALHRAVGEPRPDLKVSDIVDRIAGLHDDIRERSEAISSGEYLDDYDDYDSMNDEEPDALSAEQKDELEELFSEADALFLSHNLEDAERAYGELLKIFSDPEAEYLAESDVDVEMAEIRARHCRCVYENRSGDERANALYEAMDVDDADTTYTFGGHGTAYPMLTDVVNARRGKLRGFDDFTSQWKALLRQSASERGAKLLIEAEYLSEGPESAIDAARKLSRSHDSAYPYCISLLQQHKEWDRSVDVARGALKAMKENKHRAQVARQLHEAGRTKKDTSLQLEAKREEFLSSPTDRVLRELLEHAEELGERDKELKGVLRYLNEHRSKSNARLRVKALLVAGQLDAAYEIASKGQGVGWSYGDSATGLLYGAVLYALASQSGGKVPIIESVIKRYSEEAGFAYYDTMDSDDLAFTEQRATHRGRYFVKAICAGLSNVSIDRETKRKYEKWARAKAESRVRHIVSNQHRSAYERAAQTLAALAEYYSSSGRPMEARELLSQFRDVEFRRHRAFREELDAITLKRGRTTVN